MLDLIGRHSTGWSTASPDSGSPARHPGPGRGFLYLEIPTNTGSLIISDIYLSYPLACHSVPVYIKSVSGER